ncbi:GTPase [Paludisphaera mucosa]|uniref:GTPase n=1 Tax=Paludisphaera mucosa TaxID=3030827 RepID=A0ABT6FDQ2_9BACT|nr:GTPase [Paludisphaera mucosa]MDG3005707.1 GTPase [Paludisphaera mucosa]
MAAVGETLSLWRANLMLLLREWRSGVLLLLFLGPFGVYILLGTLWLYEHGWIIVGVLAWIAAGGLFAILAARWTTSVRTVLPPLDWDAPRTFSPHDRAAWQIVEDEAQASEALAMEALIDGDRYIETGRVLIKHLAEHYHPESKHPLDEVPVVELLSALELAAEDLAKLTRQVPGGDMITLSHWRKALQMANYISKANDLYALVSPFLNPLSGLTRIGTRELIVKPAWKNMQQNVLRWFFQAYVNRMGVHLIELFSGRLAIGVDEYRRLTRRRPMSSLKTDPDEPLSICVVGARESGKSRLIESVREVFQGDDRPIRARLEGMGLDPSLVDRLKNVKYTEVAGYTSKGTAERESRADRQSREAAVEASLDADMLVLIVDGRKSLQPSDVAFAKAWDGYFLQHPHREAPPAMVVVTGVDRPEFGPSWQPPYDWTAGQGVRETAVRGLFDSLRASLPPTFAEFAAAGLPDASPFGIVEHVLPALAAQIHRAERAALLRRLQAAANRSKVGRVVSQIGQQGRNVWTHLKNRRKASKPAS